MRSDPNSKAYKAGQKFGASAFFVLCVFILVVIVIGGAKLLMWVAS